MKKNILATVAVSMLATLCVGCGGKNVAPQANIDDGKKNEVQTEVPKDDREGYETISGYPGDWEVATFTSGKKCIPLSELEKYADTGVTIEVLFYLEDTEYYVLGACESRNYSNKLYNINNDYIKGVTPKADAYDEKNVPHYYVSIQEDGFFSFAARECWNYGKEYDCYSFSFDLTPEGIEYLKDNENQDQGISFQTYGVTITKVIMDSEPVDVSIKE